MNRPAKQRREEERRASKGVSKGVSNHIWLLPKYPDQERGQLISLGITDLTYETVPNITVLRSSATGI